MTPKQDEGTCFSARCVSTVVALTALFLSRMVSRFHFITPLDKNHPVVAIPDRYEFCVKTWPAPMYQCLLIKPFKCSFQRPCIPVDLNMPFNRAPICFMALLSSIRQFPRIHMERYIPSPSVSAFPISAR